MGTQYITLGNDGWRVLIYYNASYKDREQLIKSLEWLDCSYKAIKKAINVLKRKNTGFTFTNSDYKMSIVCIGETTSTS